MRGGGERRRDEIGGERRPPGLVDGALEPLPQLQAGQGGVEGGVEALGRREEEEGGRSSMREEDEQKQEGGGG